MHKQEDEQMNKEEQFLDLIRHSQSPFHSVSYVKKQLLEQGFQELSYADQWTIIPGGKYLLEHH